MLASTGCAPYELGLILVQLQTVGIHPVCNDIGKFVDGRGVQFWNCRREGSCHMAKHWSCCEVEPPSEDTNIAVAPDQQGATITPGPPACWIVTRHCQCYPTPVPELYSQSHTNVHVRLSSLSVTKPTLWRGGSAIVAAPSSGRPLTGRCVV